MKRFLIITLAFILCSCVEPGVPGVDIEPPVVISFSPVGQQVDPESVVTVKFSEPLDSSIEEQPLVYILHFEDVDEDFLFDADHPPLASKRKKLLVPCEVEASASADSVLLTPQQELEPGRDYMVVVSSAVTDLAGNPLISDPYLDANGHIVGVTCHVLHHFKTRSDEVNPDDNPDDDPGDDVHVVLSEILANPVGTESQGEYLEIVNLGTTSVDLDGWLIGDKGLAGQGDELGPCPGASMTVLEPDAIGIIVSQAFVKPDDLVEGVLVVCTSKNSLTSRGLKNAKGEVIVLSDQNGREMDRYGGWLSMNKDGCSGIRLDLQGGNSEDNWQLESRDPCSTPGWVPGYTP